MARLLRTGLGTPGAVRVTISPVTGLVVGQFAAGMTSDDVRSLDDDATLPTCSTPTSSSP